MLALANYFCCGVGDIFFTPLVKHVKQELDNNNNPDSYDRTGTEA
jgi:hypothetical protein